MKGNEIKAQIKVAGCMVEVTSIKTRAFSRDLGKQTRVYFWPEKETVLENFFIGRHSRPYVEFRKVLPLVLAAVRLSSSQKTRWSSKAGCSMCPCSPGFVLEDRSNAVDIPTNIHVYYRPLGELAEQSKEAKASLKQARTGRVADLRERIGLEETKS